MGAVEHGDGGAPVALTGDAPVAQTEGGALAAKAFFRGRRGDGGFCLVRSQTGELSGGHQGACSVVGLGHGRRIKGLALGLNDDLDLYVIFLGELEIALVVGRNRHHRAGSVFHEDEIGHVHRQSRAGEGVEAVAAGENPFFFGFVFRFLPLLFDLDPGHELLDRSLLGGARAQRQSQGMLRGDGHEGRAEDGVRSGGEDGERFVGIFEGEVHLGAHALADPVALHGENFFRPAREGVATGKQLLCIVGDLEKPTVHFPGEHGIVATPAGAVDDLLVGQHRLAGLAPVDRGHLLIDQPFFVHFDKKQLFPSVVLIVAGGEFAVPVVAEAHALQLFLHVVDVFVGPLGRMGVVLDRRILGGQAESVPAHGVQDIEALHPLVAGHHIADGVVADMAHVNAARRVGEHLQEIIFGPAGVFACGIGLVVKPVAAPFVFDGLEIVFHIH